MNAVEILALHQEFVATHVPGDMTGFCLDLLVRWCSDKAFLGFLKIAFVVKRQRFSKPLLQLNRELGRHFSFLVKVLSFHCTRVGQHTTTAGSKDRVAGPAKECNRHHACRYDRLKE